MYNNGGMQGMGMQGMGGMGMGGYGAEYQAGGGMGGRAAGNGAGAYSGGGYGGGAYRQGPPPRRDAEFVQGKLFLGGLDNNTSKESLLEYCSQWGEVTDYVLMEGRGFGFVTFASHDAAQQFLETREHIIDGKKVEAKAAVPKNSGSGSTLTKKMFVGGCGEISDEEFRAYFEQFGEIDDCVVLRKPDGGSRGFGFVTFKDEVAVEKCLVMQHQLNGKTVELKRAVKKEDMAAGGGYGGGTGYGGGGYGGGGGGYGNYGGAYSSGYETRTGKQPDWICPDCKNKNFGWREVCNRCAVPKPAHLKTAAVAPRTGGMGMGYSGAQRGYDGSMGMANAGMGMGSMGMGGMAGMGNMGGMAGMGGMGMGMGGMANMGMAGMAGYGMGMGGMAGYGMGGMGNMAGAGMAANGGYGNFGTGAAAAGTGYGAAAGGGYGAAAGTGYGSAAAAGGYGTAGTGGYGAAAGADGYGGGEGGYGRSASGRGSGGARYRPY